MTWFFAVLIVLAMGAVAVVASGWGGSMSQVYDDRPDARVQAEGPLTAEDLRRVRFSTALRGYRMSEVDSLLDRLAEELEAVRRTGGHAEPPAEPPTEPPAGPVEDRPGEGGPGEGPA